MKIISETYLIKLIKKYVNKFMCCCVGSEIGEGEPEGLAREGAIYIDDSSDTLYYFDGTDWVSVGGAAPTLQAVTDAGNTTDNNILLSDPALGIIGLQLDTNSIAIAGVAGNVSSVLAMDYLRFSNSPLTSVVNIDPNSIAGNRDLLLPTNSGTIVAIEDEYADNATALVSGLVAGDSYYTPDGVVHTVLASVPNKLYTFTAHIDLTVDYDSLGVGDPIGGVTVRYNDSPATITINKRQETSNNTDCVRVSINTGYEIIDSNGVFTHDDSRYIFNAFRRHPRQVEITTQRAGTSEPIDSSLGGILITIKFMKL